MLRYIGQLYAIEEQAREQTQQERCQLRLTLSVPLLDRFKAWLIEQRLQLVKADATAKAIDLGGLPLHARSLGSTCHSHHGCTHPD
jgi:hypothetical protein